MTAAVLVPDTCDSGPAVLFWAAGLRAADAGVTLPFQGVAAVLEKVLDAGEACTPGALLSAGSLGSKHLLCEQNGDKFNLFDESPQYTLPFAHGTALVPAVATATAGQRIEPVSPLHWFLGLRRNV